jgi:hypothetical protein
MAMLGLHCHWMSPPFPRRRPTPWLKGRIPLNGRPRANTLVEARLVILMQVKGATAQ